MSSSVSFYSSCRCIPIIIIKAMYLPGIGTHEAMVRQRESNKMRSFPSILLSRKQAEKQCSLHAIYTHIQPYSQLIVSVVMVYRFDVG